MVLGWVSWSLRGEFLCKWFYWRYALWRPHKGARKEGEGGRSQARSSLASIFSWGDVPEGNLHHRICPSLRQWSFAAPASKVIGYWLLWGRSNSKAVKVAQRQPFRENGSGSHSAVSSWGWAWPPTGHPRDLMRHQQHLLQEWAWPPKVPTIWKILGSFIQIMQTDFFFFNKKRAS